MLVAILFLLKTEEEKTKMRPPNVIYEVVLTWDGESEDDLDLYVQSSSIYFADMSDHGGKTWKQMTKAEKLARTTTFHKDDIDKLNSSINKCKKIFE